MNTIRLLIICLSTCYLFSCFPEGTTSNTSSGTAQDTSEVSSNTDPKTGEHNCNIKGTLLEENQLWLKQEGLLFCIVADSSTYDTNYGESHRILQVYATQDCKQIDRQVLPINTSPDFPYYLADINYNNNSHLIAIKGFQKIFCYDYKSKTLLPGLKPTFLGEQFGEDAQSGMIAHLEVWEDYLVGYAVDYGTFAFNLTNSAQLEPVLPFAEFKRPDADRTSLFLLPSSNEAYQAILPSFDQNSGKFNISPLFEQPKRISTNIPQSARNNRFLILRETQAGRQPIAIDLKSGKLQPLPQEIARQANQGILNWLKQQ